MGVALTGGAKVERVVVREMIFIFLGRRPSRAIFSWQGLPAWQSGDRAGGAVVLMARVGRRAGARGPSRILDVDVPTSPAHRMPSWPSDFNEPPDSPIECPSGPGT